MANLEGESTFLNIGIAPKFSIGGKFTISPSLNISYDQSDQRIMISPCLNASGSPVDCWEKSQYIASDAAILFQVTYWAR